MFKRLQLIRKFGLGTFSGERSHNDTPGAISFQTNPSTLIAQRKTLKIRSSVVRKKAGTCEQNGLSMSAISFDF